jgi:hypothetical protein
MTDMQFDDPAIAELTAQLIDTDELDDIDTIAAAEYRNGQITAERHSLTPSVRDASRNVMASPDYALAQACETMRQGNWRRSCWWHGYADAADNL